MSDWCGLPVDAAEKLVEPDLFCYIYCTISHHAKVCSSHIDFQFVYQGTGATMRYNTGTYLTGTDAYLVYILLKKAGNQYVVETLHFRKEQPPTAKR